MLSRGVGLRGFESHPPHQERYPLQSKVLEHAFWLKKEGYRESTIVSRVKLLAGLAKKSDLLDPESVKEAIARLEVTEARKENIVCVYGGFCRQNSPPFNPPKYHRVERLPFIPSESEVDQLIAGPGGKTTTFLQTIKETAGRPGEIWRLRWLDLDLEGQTITIAPEKNSNPRQFRISTKLVSMLNRLPKKNTFIFGSGGLDNFSRWFFMKRLELARKLENPRMAKIGFKTLRHWKASTLYHQTRDILLVMRTLGHKDIRNTLVYTHLMDTRDDEYVCKTAKSLAEAGSLIEAGFEYMTELDGVKLFRKRK